MPMRRAFSYVRVLGRVFVALSTMRLGTVVTSGPWPRVEMGEHFTRFRRPSFSEPRKHESQKLSDLHGITGSPRIDRPRLSTASDWFGSYNLDRSTGEQSVHPVDDISVGHSNGDASPAILGDGHIAFSFEDTGQPSDVSSFHLAILAWLHVPRLRLAE
jgi:hypothetical protein